MSIGTVSGGVGCCGTVAHASGAGILVPKDFSGRKGVRCDRWTSSGACFNAEKRREQVQDFENIAGVIEAVKAIGYETNEMSPGRQSF